VRQLFPAIILSLALACSTPDAASAGTIAAAPVAEGQAEAIFAGGCFWCMEKPFDVIPGVLSTTSGYTGGAELNPTYEEVAYHRTTHYEAIRVVYDPAQVTYDALLSVFWHNIDPTRDDGQFCDKGDQYRTGVFTSDPAEITAAQSSKAAAEKALSAEVLTPILPAATFWEAEDYHQDFYKKNPSHYTRYRLGCGRDRRLAELWGADAGH